LRGPIRRGLLWAARFKCAAARYVSVMRLLAPAKINLHLRVGKRRDDGFHPLLTWMCTVGLFDTLTLEAAPRCPPATGHAGAPEAAAGGSGIRFECDRPDLPRDEGNLVVRVARAFAAELHAGRGVTRVSVTLAKRIPVGAGLGGGSSDAAWTLVGLNRLCSAGWAADRLSGFAARFGSDVPFFVSAAFGAPSAACAGRGEIVSPLPAPAPKWAVLVLPPFGLSTRDVYARFDELRLGYDREVETSPDWRRWAGLEARELLSRLVNDLEPAAFSLSPRLAALREQAERTVGRVVRMSGSGSSLFTLFGAGEADEAAAAAERIARRHAVTAVAVPLAPPVADDPAA
jgi:4-diphosphocytidyl-2-C-methyl-D-erythritol kinase